jgi:glycosyltransferase involved in cell wall biosynthesis
MDRKLKIAMIAPCPFPYPRGTPVRIHRMAESLAKHGCEIHVVTYHLGNNIESDSSCPFYIHRIRNIKSYKKLSPGPSYQKLFVVDLLLLFKLLRILKKYKIDLIHAHHYEGLLISLLVKKLKKYPIIFDSHTLLGSELHYYQLGLSYKIKKFLGYLLDSKLPKHADHIISVTEDIKEKLIQHGGIDSDKISIIMNGVEIQHFMNKESVKISDNDPKKLIYTGNLGEFQGIDHLLKIFNEILKLGKHVRLQIITNSSFNKYKRLANKLGIEPFIDVIPSSFEKLPGYLHSSHIALNPRIECAGIPQKLLNYMAAGKPIVSFRGSAKILKHNQTGYIVDNKNYEEFARGVVYLLENYQLARKLGENAQNIIRRSFSWDIKAQEIINIYNKILKKFHYNHSCL